MHIAGLSVELTMLGLSVVLLIVQIFLQATTMTRELGRQYNVSARDEQTKPTGVVAGRAERALRNLLETYPAFVALTLALVVSNKTGSWGALGAQIWLAARIVHVSLYMAGVPRVRTVVWGIALLGLIMMLLRLFS
ncbi:MAG: MAPEG family protein [Xanthobacteraceae bacterium]